MNDCENNKSIFIRPVILFILIVPLILWILPSSDAGIESDELMSVSVQRGNLLETSVYYGEIRAKKTVDIHVPEFQEYFVTVKEVLDDGKLVKMGDTIIQIEDSGFRKALETAMNEFELASADRDKLKFELKNERINLELDIERKKLELEKAKVMVVENSIVISQIDLKKSKLAVELAQLELSQAEKAIREFDQKCQVALKVKDLKILEAKKTVELQQANIEKAVVKAPKDGIIFKPFVRLNNDKGRVEKSKVVSPGDKLLEIPDLSAFEGEIFISPSDNKFVSTGDRVRIFLSILPEKSFEGVVVSKDLYAMSRNERLGRNDPEGYLKEYRTVIDIIASDSVFRPGITFKAEINSVIATDCLFLPRAAVETDLDEKSCVYQKLNNEEVKKNITTGRGGINFVEISSGLAAGESVIFRRLEQP
ncbi:MAG: HlyD family efflux transporter periplasmic adaptor subunit [Candidatus Riflebacteria bacterium]|nr:HlyD family efflux transporter periplasmic adaptor subunit [Candidatus Riflebacteria bacterium]